MAAETERSELEIRLDPIYQEKRIIHAQIAELNARLGVLDNNAWVIHCDQVVQMPSANNHTSNIDSL